MFDESAISNIDLHKFLSQSTIYYQLKDSIEDIKKGELTTLNEESFTNIV